MTVVPPAPDVPEAPEVPPPTPLEPLPARPAPALPPFSAPPAGASLVSCRTLWPQLTATPLARIAALAA